MALTKQTTLNVCPDADPPPAAAGPLPELPYDVEEQLLVVSGKKSVCAAISNNPHIQWCLDALGMPANAVGKRGASPMIKAALVNGRECWVYAPTNQLEVMVRTVALHAKSTARQYLCESCGWTRAGTSTLLIDQARTTAADKTGILGLLDNIFIDFET